LPICTIIRPQCQAACGTRYGEIWSQSTGLDFLAFLTKTLSLWRIVHPDKPAPIKQDK